jgi:hypothetical protein
MKKSQGEKNNFIEFLKEKAEDENGKINFSKAKEENLNPMKLNLEKVLQEKIKEEKKVLHDIEAVLVSTNQKIINKIKFDFFQDFAKKANLDFKIFGRFITSRYFVPSLAFVCILILLFSVCLSSVRNDGKLYSAFFEKVSEKRDYQNLELANEREKMEDFILDNTNGRVAGVIESASEEKKDSSLINSLSLLAKKQVEFSKIMNNKLINILQKN